MIKLFRNIRQKLFAENRFGRYLIYATGEIILVVIGILIALALNNWNEDRKTRIVEIDLYREIRDDLVFSLMDLENGLENNYEDLDATVALRDYLKGKKTSKEEVSEYMRKINGDDQFFPRTAGFEALKSIGLETLSNDTLRESITNLYQLGFERIVGMGRDKAPVRNLQFLVPYQDKYLKLSDENFYRKVNESDSVMVFIPELVNGDQLLKDETFLLKLHDAIMIRLFKIRGYLWTINDTKSLIKEIESEINRLEG